MKRYSLRMFRYHNYQAFEEKLSQKAKQGWFLDNVGTFLWSYKKGEPRKLTYDISFFPDGPDINYYTTEGQETFVEYCEDAGWKLVGTDGHIHVFATDAENPVPIENDEQLKLENLHRCMKKSPIFNWILMVIFQIIMFFDFDYDLWRRIPTEPEVIFTYEFFSSILFKVFFVLIVLYCLVDYYIWYISCKKTLSEGLSYERKPSRTKSIIERMLSYTMIAVLTVVFIGACLNGYIRNMFVFSIMFLVMYLTIVISEALIKKTKIDKEIIIFVMPFVAIIAAIMIGEILPRILLF